MVDLRRTQIPPAKTVEGRDTKIHLRQHYSRLRMKKWIHCVMIAAERPAMVKKRIGAACTILNIRSAVILRAIA